MALDQQYRKMLRDLMLESDSLSGRQTLSDGSIIGYGANNPDAMVAAVAPPPPPQVNQQPQTPQQLSALLVNQRPQGFNDQQRFDEAYQFKQSMPEKQSYLRNNTTGAVQMLPTGQSQVAAAPNNDFNDIIRFGNVNGLDPQTIGKLVQYQGTVQAGMPSAQDLYISAFKYNRPIDEMLSVYGAAAQAQRGQLQAEKERLGIDKARAEIDQLRAKPKAEQGTWSTVESNGKTYLVNNKTGQIKAAEVGGVQLPGKEQPIKDSTEDEKKTAYHATKMMDSIGRISQITSKSPDAMTPSAGEATAAAIAGAYSGTANAARSGERQAVFGLQADLVDSLLYLATGAAYNKEQLEQKRESLLPAFTDKPAAIEEKKRSLQEYMRAAKIRAGKAWKPEMEAALNSIFTGEKTKSLADQIPTSKPNSNNKYVEVRQTAKGLIGKTADGQLELIRQ